MDISGVFPVAHAEMDLAPSQRIFTVHSTHYWYVVNTYYNVVYPLKPIF